MKRYIAMASCAILVAIALFVVPASGVTSWYTKGSVYSRGGGYWDTSATVQTVVQNPYAIRMRFRTSNNKSNKVTYSYSVICDNGSRSAYDRTLWTYASNNWRYVTVYSGNRTLGDFCDVYVTADLGTTAVLRTQIQAKHR